MGIAICTECFDKNFLPFENNIDRKYTFTFHHECSVCDKLDNQHICITTMPIEGQSDLLTIKHYLLEYEIAYRKQELTKANEEIKTLKAGAELAIQAAKIFKGLTTTTTED